MTRFFWLLLASGCAVEPVELECIDEETFEQRWIEAACVKAYRCGELEDMTPTECIEWVRNAGGLDEGKAHLLRVCPEATYDPCEAAACLDAELHSPVSCETSGVFSACGDMDWYQGVCLSFRGEE